MEAHASELPLTQNMKNAYQAAYKSFYKKI